MITIGADPELFVAKAGKFVSAHNLIPGTKDKPHKVDKGAVQVDGMALEFNINPARTYKEFQDNLDNVYETLMGMVSGFEPITSPSIVLSSDDIAALPAEAVLMGCSPDVNVYTEEPNPSPDPDTDVRAAGGHIHIGGVFPTDADDDEEWDLMMRLGKLMDKYVGVYSVLWDDDTLRRTIYGKAGSIRPKPYGLEYRTLSNAWIFNKQITKFVFFQTMKAVKALKNGEVVTHPSIYRNIINTSDKNSLFFHNNLTADILKHMLA